MKNLILFVAFMFLASTGFAQNETKKWAVGAGVGAIDFSGPMTKSYFDFDEFKGSGRIFVGRYLNPSFNAKLDLNFGKVWFPTVTAYPDVVDGVYKLAHIYDAGLAFEYKFNNGYIFKENAVVGPYLFSGLGMNSILGYPGSATKESDINAYIPFGIGFNIRPSDWLTINLQSAYKMNIDNSFDYTHHAATLVYNFGQTKMNEKVEETAVTDSDMDGVPDLIDECPFSAGTKAYFGCPDTDGDGIGDSRDNCPNEAGPMDKKGCPTADSDGDGVPDDKDSCPNLKGEKRYAGCPDTDGDGIVDKYDQCPNQAGMASNNGCPKDGTGIITNPVITTPIVTTPVITTPVVTTPVVTTPVITTPSVPTPTVSAENKFVIYFGSAADQIPAAERAKLDKVVAIMKANPGSTAKATGYADSAGDEYENVNLSLERATSVWRYLMNKGVKGDKIEIYGLGEYFSGAGADQKNRKVEVEIFR